MFGINSPEFLSKYTLGRHLGTGSTAIVLEAANQHTGDTFAVKVFDRYQLVHHSSRINNEIKILQLIDHLNSIKLLETFQTDSHILLVFEMVDKEDLFDYIQRRGGGVPEGEALMILRQLVDVLEYIHDRNVIHRDLKPENILILSHSNIKIIKLADFGSACIVSPNEKVSRLIGTLEYFAPEQLLEQPYDKAVDMWALGITCFAILTGRCVFYDENEEEKWKQTVNGDVKRLEDLHGCSELAKDFMRKLLVVDPAKRMTAKEAKNHPWFNQSIDLFSGPASILTSPLITRTKEITSCDTPVSPFSKLGKSQPAVLSSRDVNKIQSCQSIKNESVRKDLFSQPLFL